MQSGSQLMAYTGQPRFMSLIEDVAKKALFVPLCLFMVPGTGGAHTEANITQALSTYRVPGIEIRGIRSRKHHVMSVSQQMESIRNVFGLRMSEVAQIFGVTRPAAYAWLNGSEPKPEIRARLLKISEHAEELRNAGLLSVEDFTRQPVIGGRTLLDFFKSGGNVQDAVNAVKRTALADIQEVNTSVSDGARASKKRVDIEEISVPVFL